MLAYITPEEGGILKALGGAGKPGPMGIPSFFVDDFGDFSSVGDDAPSVDDSGGGSQVGGGYDDSGNTDTYIDDSSYTTGGGSTISVTPSGSDDNFSIGLDPNRISDNMFTNYVKAGSNPVTNVFDLGGGVGDFGFGTTRSQNFLNPQPEIKDRRFVCIF